MLAGESAGAVAVLLHLALPASGPGTMFQSAAVHSAPCIAAPHRFECVSSLATMQRTVADPLAAAAGCTRATTSELPGLDEQVCRKRLSFPLSFSPCRTNRYKTRSFAKAGSTHTHTHTHGKLKTRGRPVSSHSNWSACGRSPYLLRGILV
eukprot:COSAG06_NODE_6943_length_2704_cov_7.914377_1_plen_151_part_00